MLKKIREMVAPLMAPTKLVNYFNSYTEARKEDYRHVVLLIDDKEYVPTRLTDFHATVYRYYYIFQSVLVAMIMDILNLTFASIYETFLIILIMIIVIISLPAISIRLFVTSLKPRTYYHIN